MKEINTEIDPLKEFKKRLAIALAEKGGKLEVERLKAQRDAKKMGYEGEPLLEYVEKRVKAKEEELDKEIEELRKRVEFEEEERKKEERGRGRGSAV